ncbi:MAG: hypothetical protein AB1792_01210 [Candidatus Zixiibacteriota bacterium]
MNERHAYPLKVLLISTVMSIVGWVSVGLVPCADSVRAGPPDAAAPAIFTFGHCPVVWTDGAPRELRSRMERVVAEAATGAVDEGRTRLVVETLLRALANEGHHHASVEPRDFTVHDASIEFTLAVDPGPLTVVAGWRFEGVSRTDTVWLSRVLDLRVGMTATRSALEAIMRRLRRISHLQCASPPELELLSDDTLAIVTVYVRELPATTFAGALAAGEGGSAAGAPLSGNLALGMAGMFRRDRSFGLRYERWRRDEMLLRLDVAEAGKSCGRWDWRAQLEEWNHRDHRQHARLETAYRLDRRHELRATVRAQWSKITPDRAVVPAARTTEIGLGIGQGMIKYATPGSEPPTVTWSCRLTNSTRRELAVPGRSGRRETRTLFEWNLAGGLCVGRGLMLTVRGWGRSWPNSETRLGPGDEWFLGGSEWLRGYADRTVIATAGVATALELSVSPDRAVGASIFGDAARLLPFDRETGSRLTPYSYGAAVLLRSSNRSGRLEFAWRDHVAWRDGIVRLAVSQGW